MARMTTPGANALERHQNALAAAKDEAAIRQVQKAALADPAVSHAQYHALGKLARAKIAKPGAPGTSPAEASDAGLVSGAPGKKGART
ncbi:MAG: hypothetical protein FWG81_02300 [Betaproteobacteria bacterium]|nr:hypothetical protein [Betaproteobacteria bacterium]